MTLEKEDGSGSDHRHGFCILTIALCGWLVAIIGGCDWIGREQFSDYVGPASASARKLPVEGAAPATRPATAPATEAADAGPLVLSVSDAILMSLANNRGLIVDKFNPPIKRTTVEELLGAYDPLVTGSVSQGHIRPRNGNSVDTTAASLGVSEFFPTGTQVQVTGSTNLRDPNSAAAPDISRLEATVTQSLLRGFGLAVNLASIRQARLDVLSSQYELRGFTEALVAQVEQTYWDYVLAQQQIAIVQQSLELAQRQLEETRERINVGKLAATELAATESELAVRKEALIDARSLLATTRLRLLRLLSPPSKDMPNGDSMLWQRSVTLTDQPNASAIKLDDVENYVQVALRMRSDLNQARLLVQRGDLEIIKTRNGLLPRLDFFVTLGKTGFSDSFGGTMNMDQRAYDLTVGLTGDWSPINRAVRARDDRARTTRDQSIEALANMAQLVQTDVRGGYIEVIRLQEQIVATAATRRAQEETYRAEKEKFGIGKSTSLLVAAAERDLLQGQINEVQAVVNYLKAIADLHRLDGSLLERRGIVAPGGTPVTLSR